VEPCGTACFERPGRAIAVLEELDVRDLVALETRQETKWRCDFLAGRDRFVGERAEEGDAVSLFDRVGDLEVERVPKALDGLEDFGSD